MINVYNNYVYVYILSLCRRSKNDITLTYLTLDILLLDILYTTVVFSYDFFVTMRNQITMFWFNLSDDKMIHSLQI